MLFNRRKYIEGGGVACPFCGSENIEGGSVEIDCGFANQNVGCADCGAEWLDYYVLNGVILVTYPEAIHES